MAIYTNIFSIIYKCLQSELLQSCTYMENIKFFPLFKFLFLCKHQIKHFKILTSSSFVSILLIYCFTSVTQVNTEETSLNKKVEDSYCTLRSIIRCLSPLNSRTKELYKVYFYREKYSMH